MEQANLYKELKRLSFTYYCLKNKIAEKIFYRLSNSLGKTFPPKCILQIIIVDAGKFLAKGFFSVSHDYLRMFMPKTSHVQNFFKSLTAGRK